MLNESGLYRSERDSIFWSLVSDSDELPLLLSAFSADNNNCISIDYKNKFIYVGTSNGIYRLNIVTGIEESSVSLTFYNFLLHQNYPNPFNPSTTISYQISEISFITLKIYDILGNEIATLVNEEQSAGSYEIKFSAQGGSRSGVDAWNLPSGIYIYRLTSGKFSSAKKLILLK